jgi:hypothetical protein
MREFDEQKNKNLRRLCKMARAWKNKQGVSMGGLLVDTLAHNFLQSTNSYDDKSYASYDWMVRDFFKYLADEPVKERYAALGSRQHVTVKKNFQRKAKRAYELCLAAIQAEGTATQNSKWKKVFGRPFPPDAAFVKKAIVERAGYSAHNTEEFFEDRFPFDIRYDLHIECDVTQDGFRPFRLTEALLSRLRLAPKRSLRFHVSAHTVPGKYQAYWKVLNRGDVAVKKDKIRGQLVKDAGRLEIKETTNFFGDHIVECAIVQNGVVVAINNILVPID